MSVRSKIVTSSAALTLAFAATAGLAGAGTAHAATPSWSRSGCCRLEL